MIAEVKLVKRFLGAKFGYGEELQTGVYAVPAWAGNRKAFMRIEISHGNFSGEHNFKLYWDEDLKLPYKMEKKKPRVKRDSKFAKAFRKLEEARY